MRQKHNRSPYKEGIYYIWSNHKNLLMPCTGETRSSMVNTVDTKTTERLFEHAGQVCADYM